jgi:hypothetical protein
MKPPSAFHLLDSIAGDYIPENSNLLPRLRMRFASQIRGTSSHNRPVQRLLFVFLFLVLLACVIYAVGRSTGYIPGVGIVDQSNGIRILPEPVSVMRNGITVTVEKVVADSLRTFVVYRIDGIFDPPRCLEPPALQLPDGRTLTFLGGGEGGMDSSGGGFTTQYSFPPIPANIMSVTFLSPCQMPALELALAPAPAGYATPAVDIAPVYTSLGPRFSISPTPGARLSPAPPDSSLLAAPSPVPHGSGLYLDKVVELENAYILIGNFTDAGDLPGVLSGDYSAMALQITGSRGESIPAKPRKDIHPAVEWGGVWYWAYEIAKPVNGPLTLTLAGISIERTESVRIRLDVGQNPQPGQTWKLTQTVRVDGYDFIVEDVTMVEYGYTIRYLSDKSISDRPDVSFGFEILAGTSSSTRGEESSHPSGKKVENIQTILYAGAPPVGELIFSLGLSQFLPLAGPWTLIWSPP